MPTSEQYELRATGEGLPERLLTDGEFGRWVQIILNSPQSAGYELRFSILSVSNNQEVARYCSSDLPSTDATETRELLTDMVAAVTARCEIWRLPQQGVRADLNALLARIEQAIGQHWGERDPATMLPFLKSPSTPKRLIEYARFLAGTDNPVAVLHTDLDHFKAVNGEIGEEGGDKVLREFSDRFRHALSDVGVVVRTGGEEFSAILQGNSVAQLVELTDHFRETVGEHPFSVLDRNNTCSVGLSLYENADFLADVQSPDEILSTARAAEVRAKDDGRNRTCLCGPTPSGLGTLEISETDLKIAVLSSRNLLQHGRGPQRSVIEAVVEKIVTLISAGNVPSAAVAETRRALGLLIGEYELPDARAASLIGILDCPTWAQSIAQALFLAAYRGTPVIAPLDRLTLRADREGHLSIQTGSLEIKLDCLIIAQSPFEIDIGRPIYLVDACPVDGVARQQPAVPDEQGHDPFSPVLIMPIGDDAKVISERLRGIVAGTLDIDDRPTLGGGLPDFWQSNVSRVIREVLANPNICSVLAIGDPASARHTIDRILAATANEGDLADLQRRLSIGSDKLSAFRERRIELKTVPAVLEDVVSSLADAVQALSSMDFQERPVFDPSTEKNRRRLPIARPDHSHRLLANDGLRTRTLSDAYPEALQLIRSADTEADYLEGRRGRFRELTGFKVVLTDPLQEPIPDYWDSDRGLLDTYYEETFLSSTGLFGERLNAPFGSNTISMIDFAAQQTADALERVNPTRRINLPIVPNNLSEPLGLSSIQLMPRCRGDDLRLDVLYVWRTVDALVGFPFSGYASIRWAKEFVERVQVLLSVGEKDSRVSIGDLTYIALSFHMYLHEGDLEIARTIVQDASL